VFPDRPVDGGVCLSQTVLVEREVGAEDENVKKDIGGPVDVGIDALPFQGLEVYGHPSYEASGDEDTDECA
jgi:hypothetical protein